MKYPVSRCIVKGWTTLASISVLTGCATVPPTQEMSDARQSVEAAASIGAEKHAPVALSSAQQLLSKAQDDLKAGEYKDAQREALAAREAARRAMAISQAKQESATVEKIEPPAPVAEEETPAPTSPPVSLMKRYTVAENDNLWSISAKHTIYGDPLLWPLLLKDNADQILNADVISPGLELTIDPAPSEPDKAAARAHAKQRGDAARRAKDASYLNRYGLR